MNDISRRDCMTLALAATAAGSLSFHAAAAGNEDAAGTGAESLNGLAASKGLRFGSCVGDGPSGAPGPHTAEDDVRANSFADPNMRALLVSQCGMLVPENELKWYALRKTPTSFDFRRADVLVDFATRHKMAVRGHTLLWNKAKWFPDWVAKYDFGSNPRAEAERMLREHINTVCGRYKGRIFAYDVINETINPKTGELEDTVFTKYLGPDVVDIAFHTAREAAPHAQLVYNDYMSWSPGNEKHRAAVLKLLERMRKNNVPIDALGIQSHISTADVDPVKQLAAVQSKEWRNFLDEVVGMGLDLVITEFDVNDKELPADITIRDRAVADFGRAYFDLMLSYPRLRYVMAWGLVDKYSWLQNTSARPDGLPKRPCPYDDNYKPKLLRNAMAEAFRSAPARPAMDIRPA